MDTVKLIDGRQVDRSSEEWRHECEARFLIGLPTIDERRDFLAGIEKKRGAAEADRLRATAEVLWEARKTAAHQAGAMP